MVAATFALSLAGAAPAALAVSWNDYKLGEFYDISQASDPAVRNVGHAVVFFGNATGFIVSPEGHVITNYHVYQSFGNGGTVYVEYTSAGYRRTLALSLIFARPDYDMAMYKANVTGIPYVRIDPSAPYVGEDVFIVGHPNGATQEVSFGKVLRTTQVLPHSLPSVFHSVEYSAQTWWGSSGSPVCNRAGNVIALHWGWDANGVSTGRLAGVPMFEAVRAIPELARVVAAYGVGAGTTAGTSGGSGSGSSAGSGTSAGSGSGSGSTAYVYPGTPRISGGHRLGRARGGSSSSGSSSGGSSGSSSGGSSFRTLPIGGYVTGNLAAAGASEYFRLDLSVRGDLEIDLQGPSNADFDLAVWKWNFGTNRGSKLGTSDGQTSTEQVVIRDATPGTYVVIVNAYAGSGAYRLAADLQQQTGLGSGTARASASGVLAGTGDWRLYQFDSAGGNFLVTLDGPSGTDFDVYVFRGLQVDVNNLVAYGEGTTSHESVPFSAPAGQYAILVRSASGSGQFTVSVR